MLYSYFGIILTYIICPFPFYNYIFTPQFFNFIFHSVYNCIYSGTWFYDTGDLPTYTLHIGYVEVQ